MISRQRTGIGARFLRAMSQDYHNRDAASKIPTENTRSEAQERAQQWRVR
jgi:hypothetical protein